MLHQGPFVDPRSKSKALEEYCITPQLISSSLIWGITRYSGPDWAIGAPEQAPEKRIPIQRKSPNRGAGMESS